MEQKSNQHRHTPLIPPRGWKQKVAQLSGVSEKTVYNTLSGRILGPKSRQVIEAYRKILSQDDEEDSKTRN
ncbi:helix-turn-helix domain-containing protein [Bacteroides sp.]|uniref:hypothetical protein n=1 Tax=Bacteroides sp. TaxID=29523 RepID=UPI0025C64DE8|nr:hypothetical protein [Bacteroides sp.]